MPMKRGITRDYTPFPSNITRDDPPITSDCPPSLLMLQGRSLTVQHLVEPRDEGVAALPRQQQAARFLVLALVQQHARAVDGRYGVGGL